MTSTVISSYVVHFLKEEMHQSQKKLLAQVGEDFDIDVDLLQRRYGTLTMNESRKVTIVRRREYNKNLLDCNRCGALNSRYQRCKRSKLKEDCAKFCVAHRNKQPYGVYLISSPPLT